MSRKAFQFFDSQNSRGKALSPHDLLKSYHLREMNDESESDKIEIIQAWENKNQSELEDLFADNLFPLVRWYKNKNGLIILLKIFKLLRELNLRTPIILRLMLKPLIFMWNVLMLTKCMS